MTILYTSLAEIKSFKPCPSGWKDILKGQGKTEADDVLFPLKDCLKSNSFADICWLLGKRKNEISIAVNAAKMCADSVAHFKGYAVNAIATANEAADFAAYNATVTAATAADDCEYHATFTVFYAAYDDAACAAIDAATNFTAAFAAREIQAAKNKQFLLDAILQYESEN